MCVIIMDEKVTFPENEEKVTSLIDVSHVDNMVISNVNTPGGILIVRGLDLQGRI